MPQLATVVLSEMNLISVEKRMSESRALFSSRARAAAI